jgi:hypothetical protein
MASAAWVAGAAAITPIKVPQAISDRTQLELSGITWSPALSRFLVVSDDVTDLGKRHAPLLFTIRESGQMDPTPLGIAGVSSLNDLESITAGPNDSVFVCTSHSINTHGHRHRRRRRLLHLALGPGREARILGQIDLTTAPVIDGQAALEDEEGLDIEAIAFRAGSLYLGLKAPLALDGSATILRLANAVSAVDAGVVPASALSVWSRSRFCVARRGISVCEGIADLTFLGDGRLLVVANSPKGMPSDGGGSLWQLAQPNGIPTLLERFAHLKPEGVALSPDQTLAVVVFDRGGLQPVWTSWPLHP